jgi:exo-beta-1,3-glucanase (GH17 family)
MNSRMKRHQYTFAVILIIFITMLGCGKGNKPMQGKEDFAVEYEGLTRQDRDALLGGLSKAVCYSGFRSGQHPNRGEGAVNPGYEEILEDLEILSRDSNFQLIRLYDCGENSEMALKVIRENNIDIKVLLGIWLDAELSSHEGCAWLTEPIPPDKLISNKGKNIGEIERGIRLAREYRDVVIAVNVGNESLVDWNDHLVDVDTVISYVKTVKNSIEQPVTVADNYKWWADQGAELAKAVDFLAIHVYPIWLGKDIDSGLAKTMAEISEVQKAIPGKNIVISEAGWASIASEFGERASEEKQMRYYNEIMSLATELSITTFFFEAFDEDWKGNPDNTLGAEKHWGLFTVDRKPKMVMKSLYPELLDD